MEIATAVLLALASVCSAWSACLSTRRHGAQSRSYNDSIACRAHATELFDLSGQQTGIDSDMFVDYMAVYARGDEGAIKFFKERMFSPGLKKAVDAWEKQTP